MKALIKKLETTVQLENIPRPSTLKENEVLIKVDTVGLCRTDLFVASGKIAVENDLVLGHEFSGVVIKGSKEWLNKKVAVNPLYINRKFMGLHFDGALTEEVIVPVEQIVSAEKVSSKIAAYLEPVAASMAILNANLTASQKGAVYGKNRIAELTYIIAKTYGLDVDWIDESNKQLYAEDTYDYIIETLFTEEDLKAIFNMLKVGGKLVVKSRKKQPVAIDASQLVSKNLTMQAVNYYDFDKSMQWLEENAHLVEHLLGESYYIDKWEEAFKVANTGESKKIFIHF